MDVRGVVAADLLAQRSNQRLGWIRDVASLFRDLFDVVEAGLTLRHDRSGGARSELWYLPRAGHTAALKHYPDAYERRVTEFLDAHLLT